MEEVKKKEKRELQPIWKILIILVVMVVGIFGVLYVVKSFAGKVFYKVQFSSVEENLFSFYVVVNIESDTEIEIKAEDFSVMVSGVPISSNGIAENSTVIITFENTIKVNGSKTVKVLFSRTLSSVDSPLSISYKGKKLSVGNKTTFQY